MPVPAIYLNHPKRLEAIASGLNRFDPEKPCNFGHTSLRYVNTGLCVACNDERNATRRTNPNHRERGPAKKIIPAKVLKARRVEEIEKRRKSMAKLPRKAAFGLYGYSESLQAKRNSKFLDSLLKRI
jgi:hypothetical protein